MPTEQQYFEDAIAIENYMAQMESNQKTTYAIYEKFTLPEDQEFIGLLKEKQPHVLVITEDWCGDAMMNNAILRRIAEAADLEVRCVYRDQNPELVDQYLTNGGRSIPKYIFLSKEGEVLGHWGPRAPKIQEFVMEKRATLPEKDDPRYALNHEAMIGEISDAFTWNTEFWQAVYEDLRKTFMKALK
ncbi:thioredoxin family protein [Planococcus shixiaomingii]|uniref:thioredoxin family protein n=1 Tax=Planococcus shixiaomingii TaxID=3058393 RepID=UPI00260E795C|nr:thioredoxin family protein [Planococcus sp. N022]WKA55793.1 thioredoxin family protein [Planococcus sp. N022]